MSTLFAGKVRDVAISYRPYDPSLRDSHIILAMGISFISVEPRVNTCVQRYPPSEGIYKLNTDGSNSGGECTGGGFIRDLTGSVIRAYSSFYGIRTNSVGEVRALLDGLLLG